MRPVKEDSDQCEAKDQGSRGTATHGVLWLHEWVFILLCSAVRLTCAICLGLGDGRLQRLLRRDCSLSHGRTGICVKATKPAVWKTSAVCNTTVTLAHTHSSHLHPTALIHRPFIYSFTINHSIHSPQKARLFVLLPLLENIHAVSINSGTAGRDFLILTLKVYWLTEKIL